MTNGIRTHVESKDGSKENAGQKLASTAGPKLEEPKPDVSKDAEVMDDNG